MSWIAITDSVLFVVFYLVLTCGSAYRISSYESGLAVRVPYSVRIALLIFSFKLPKISVLVVVYQVYTYIMLGFFLISRWEWMQIFLEERFPNIDQVYSFAFLIQVIGLFSIALIEEGIFYLVKGKGRR